MIVTPVRVSSMMAKSWRRGTERRKDGFNGLGLARSRCPSESVRYLHVPRYLGFLEGAA